MEDSEVSDLLERRDVSTDTIIEELKALARSMLESTEAVRQKTRNGEGFNSYGALLSALDSSTPVTKKTIDSTVVQKHHDPLHGFSLSKKIDEDELGFSNIVNHSISTVNIDKKNINAKDINYQNEFDSQENNSVYEEENINDDDDNEIIEEESIIKGKKKSINSRITAIDCSADSDDNIYDGVKTRVVFKAVDPVLYQEISSCTWQPELLRLRLETGETVEIGSEDEEEDFIDNNDDKEDIIKPGTKKVFRVPSFPFGGGVTEIQAQILSKMFSDTIRRRGLSTSIKPLHITKNNFINYEYEECAITEESRKLFKPISPFEFVVELEREVVFDAVRAREERRREFRRLAKEGKAPVTMGSFDLRVIMDPLKTGFEEEKTFPIERGTIIADRYQIIGLLGKATFSRAVRCYDLHDPIYDDVDDDNNNNNNNNSVVEADKVENILSSDFENKIDNENKEIGDGVKKKRITGYSEVCLKIINNSKDFFDQSLDEIRLLTLINKYRDPDKAHVIRLIDSFYYKEHTMLVTELLSDNLYEYSKYNREEEENFYFTIPRLRRIARQITEALAYVHSLNLIHADLKPENILFVSHRRCIIKVIDFGSSCFLSDHLSSYIQSRSYRAPEVILGCDYDGRIDVWSLGAILVELVTGEVLFTSETVPEMLARIVYVCGQPLPRRMLWEGRHTSKFINKFGCIYEQGNRDGEDNGEDSSYYYLYTPVPQSIKLMNTKENKNNNDGEDSNKEEEEEEKNTYLGERPFSVLRKKLADNNLTDSDFISFVESCLTLDHKKRPRSKDLLSHPFLKQSD